MTTTDIVLHTGRELAVQSEFATNYPAIAPSAEMAAMMADILGDETLEMRNLPLVKCPPAEADYFSFEAGGKTQTPKRLKGYLVHYIPQRGFWTNPVPTGVPPVCASSDNKRPDAGGLYGAGGEREHENPTGLCSNCPMAQKGTDLKGGRQPACKEQRRLFVVLKGLLLPTVVSVPPSSIKTMKDFLVSMAMSGTGWWSVPIEISLEKATNAEGKQFNKIILSGDEEGVALGENELEAVNAYRDYVKELISSAPPLSAFDTATTGGFSVGDGEAEGEANS